MKDKLKYNELIGFAFYIGILLYEVIVEKYIAYLVCSVANNS